ncbi:vitamin B12 transporter [Marinobacter persicus]|uniref:Vitamin B12 transporter n=1 Tax=Marinobacter persicus TaxID=930118 RepID=A0A1I3SPY5_9GAMM|nr:TonB-dependent receptor [Marinobacter persicus]SFJ60593.1 vitamin B12 transporter [Marinobacter persicus]
MGISKASPALLCSTLSFALLPLASAVAQANESESSNDTSELDPIVVTATLGPRTVGESLSSVTVIDEEEIREKAPNDFQDLLHGQPGVSVKTNGSFGKTTSVYTRGTSNASTLFMVDGVRLHSATSGGASWQYFPPELVERVEIVRGPKSSLYGADALGGVVQAFTLDPEKDRTGWIEAGTGNFDTQKTAAGVGGKFGNTRVSLSGVHRETDGTAVVTDGEDKGYRNTSGVGRVAHEFHSGGEASVMMFQSGGSTEYDGGEIDYLLRTVGASLDAPVNDYWRQRVQFSESRDETENLAWGSEFNTRTRIARWTNTLTWDVHEFAVGTELMSDEVKSTTAFDETSRTNAALFGQLRLNFGPSDLQLSLRGDDNEAYGTNDTGAIALGHQFDRSHRMRVSYGTAFRAPTFNDLYYPLEVYGPDSSYSGNPELEPEESETLELGFSGNYQTWFWDVAAYQLDVENLIALETDSSGLMSPKNVDKARIRGLELQSGLKVNGWTGKASVSLMDPENKANGKDLEHRSTQTLKLDLSKQIDTWNLGATLVAANHSYDDEANDDRLPGYGTLDLRAGWNFAPGWSSKLSVKNVFDKERQISEKSDGVYYITAGRTAMLTVRYDFQ